jgi:hypothetical protein
MAGFGRLRPDWLNEKRSFERQVLAGAAAPHQWVKWVNSVRPVNTSKPPVDETGVNWQPVTQSDHMPCEESVYVNLQTPPHD